MTPSRLQPLPLSSSETWPDALGAQSLAVTFVAEVVAEMEGENTGRFELRTGRQHYQASLAASCLVPPQPGDQVACWRVAQGESDAVFVVAVLTRQQADAPSRVRLGEGVEIKSHQGAMTLHASTSVRLDTPAFEMQAEKVSLVYRSLQSIGEMAAATIGQIRLVGSMLSSVFDSQVHHAKQHQRTVDGVDRLQAQVIQQQASSLLHLQGENLLANGERVIKMQGAQIHLG